MLMTIFIFIFMAYGWAMRGTPLGHSKGALLPGAIIGMLLALFSGSRVLAENFLIPAAFGALGFYLAGDMTDGQTIGLALQPRGSSGLARGFTGLFIKGFVWFGCGGALIAVGLAFVFTGRHSLADILLLVLPLLVCRYCGEFLLNRPHGYDKKSAPKLYFSRTSKESWGGFLFSFVYMCVWLASNGETFGLVFAAVSARGGGLAWLAAILLYRLTNRLDRKGTADGWKVMEYALGGLGGVGMRLGWQAAAAVSPGFLGSLAAPLPVDGTALRLMLALWFVLICAFAIARTKPALDANESLLEVVEPALFFVLPLPALLAGSRVAAALVALALIWQVLCEFMLLWLMHGYRGLWIYRIVGLALMLGAAALCLIRPESVSPMLCVLFYTAGYTVFCWLCELHPRLFPHRGAEPAPVYGQPFKNTLPVNVSFGVCCALIIAGAALLI